MSETNKSNKRKAKRSKVKNFYQLDIDIKDEGEGKVVATYCPHRYRDLNIQRYEFIEGKIRNFPFIFQGDGSPWELGNLYLIYKFNEDSVYKRPSLTTYKAYASHIADFRRWLESRQETQLSKSSNISDENIIDEFYMPRFRGRRVTYQYRGDLINRCKQGFLAWTTAANRINSVVGFYQFLKVTYPERFDYSPYDVNDVVVNLHTKTGPKKVIKQTTDLKILVSKVDASEESLILDEGQKLRPLDSHDQELINKHLALMNNYTFQLILWVVLYTGARVQTALTLTIKSLRYAYKRNRCTDKGEYLVDVGAGTDVDLKFHSKNNKRQKLHISKVLMERLIEYVGSHYARECRNKSFYGDNDRNYVFLSSRGNAYYTSTRELKDRNDPSFSKRIHPRDAVNFPVTEGESVRQWVDRLNGMIQKENEGFRRFRIHDLRATYAMNFVRNCLNLGKPEGDILNDLIYRMGHEDPQTTMIYIRFDQQDAYRKKIQNSHSDQVHEVVFKYGLKIIE